MSYSIAGFPAMRRWLALASLLPAVVSGAAPALEHAWELTHQMRAREAAELFRPLANSGSREAELGATLADLETPPFTAARLAECRLRLQALADANRDDETGIRARYLLGRFHQVFDAGEGSGDAPELVELGRDHPAHYLAQLGLVKLVLHRLYAPGPPSLDPVRLQEAESAAARLTDRGLLRDYHLVLGDAYLFCGDRRGPALHHYTAASALGIPDSAIRATVLVQIGELARLQGEADVAIGAYRRFLGEFPRDIRGFEIRKRLAALEAKR